MLKRFLMLLEDDSDFFVAVEVLFYSQFRYRLSAMTFTSFVTHLCVKRLLHPVALILFVVTPICGQITATQGASDTDSLEFESRIGLYRYLQGELEEFFDSGDSLRYRNLVHAADFIAQEYGDSFYVRQCTKFNFWRTSLFAKRDSLKMLYFAALSRSDLSPSGIKIYSELMREAGAGFLEIGDSSAAVNCWQHAAFEGLTSPGSESVEKLLDRAVQVSRQCGDLDALGRSFNILGRHYEQGGMYIRAGAYFDSARVISSRLDDLTGVADGLFNIASVYLTLGDKSTSLRFAEEALKLRSESSDTVGMLKSLLTLVPAFCREVPKSQCQRWLDSTETLVAAVNRGVPAQLDYCRATLAEVVGQLDSAGALYRQALKKSSNGRNSRLALAVLQSLASLEVALGDYSNALVDYVQAQELATSGDNRVALAAIFHNLGSLHQRLGDLESAADYYQRALAIRQQSDLRLQSVETLSNLAELYLDTGDTLSASNYAQQAAKVAGLGTDRRRQASVLVNLARLEQVQGHYDAAMATLDSAALLEADALTLQRRIDFLCLAAEFSRQSGKQKQAEARLDLAYTLLDSCDTYSNRQRLDQISATLAMSRSDWNGAFGLLSTVITRADRSRGKIPDPQLRSSFQSRSRFVYEQMINVLDHLLKEGGGANAMDSLVFYIEKAKSRSLLDAIASSTARREKSGSPTSMMLERQLLKKIEDTESSLVDEADKKALDRKLAQLVEYDRELADLRLKISLAKPTAASVYQPRPLPIKSLQNALPDDRTALLSYLLTPDTSYLLLIDKSRSQFITLPKRSVLTTAVGEYSRLIQMSIKDDSLLDSLDSMSRILGDMLLPAASFDPTLYDHVIISADGVLTVLPFESLRLRGKYLVEYASVAGLPSLFLISPDRPRTTSRMSGRLLAISDPRNETSQRQLPYSARETDWISEVFGKANCTVLTADRATKASLLKLNLRDYQIIHAATHSTINYEDPLRSRIWLSADTTVNSVDSYLTLGEVDDMRLAADLVVLSSCESGGGKLDIGEGMDGFVKAFLQAGASNVIVSLWEVEDFTTATFMKSFYENLSSGYASALRTAKLEMIKSPRLRHRHPSYWSPFVLTVSDLDHPR